MRVHGLSEEPHSGRDPPLIKAFNARAEALVWVGGDSEHKSPSVGRMDLLSYLRDKNAPNCHPSNIQFTQLAPNPVTSPLFSPRTCVKLMLCNKFQRPDLGGSITGNRPIYWRTDLKCESKTDAKPISVFSAYAKVQRQINTSHNLTHTLWGSGINTAYAYSTLKQPQACFDHTGSAS